MFEFIRAHTRLFQGILVLLIFPSFVFFGVQGYSSFREAGNAQVASIDGQSISQNEWDAAHQRAIDGMRRQMPNLDVKLLDTPQMRQETLEAMVRERVLLTAAQKLHLLPTDARLKRLFVADPQYGSLRNPDGTVNKDILAAQGMSSEMFVQQLRLELGMRQVLGSVTESAFAPKAVVSTAFDALMQRREVQAQRFDTKDYEAKVNPSDADLEAYYKDNQAQFRKAEQADIEYVVLDLDGIRKGITVPEEDLKRYYSENLSRYTLAEERRASHILVKADKSAPAADRQKAKAKAEGILADLRKAPGSFAETAKKQSDDPGSASKGGDLDFFGRGAMVKAFEDAVFGMKAGEISPVVESDFGYHIIRLDAVRGGDKKPFDAVRGEIEAEVGKQLAQRKFAEVAEQFTNTVYEQSDSLQPAVDKFKLEKKTATVMRTPMPGQAGPLASAKLLETLFSTDSINSKRNTDAVDLGNSQLVSARIVKHQPASVLPLAEVRDRVRQAVVRKQAAALAVKDGKELLAKLQGNADTALGQAVVLSRGATQQLPRDVIDAVLRADGSKLPAAVGVDLGEQGYWVGRVTKVLPPDAAEAGNPQLAPAYARAWAAAESAAYFESLKKRYKVETKAAAAVATAASAPAR